MSRALVPVNAGVLSALGMLAAEASRERSRTINKPLKDCDAKSIDKIFEELLAHAVEELGAVADSITTILTVDVRYQGQSNALNLPWQGLQAIDAAFHQKHKDSYGHDLDIDIELVNLRVRAIEQRQLFELPVWQPWEELEITEIMMPGIGQAVSVINRAGLQVGQQIKGPALITEVSATTWLAENWSAVIDEKGSLKLSSD
jgi:N-methylhydantoinase A